MKNLSTKVRLPEVCINNSVPISLITQNIRSVDQLNWALMSLRILWSTSDNGKTGLVMDEVKTSQKMEAYTRVISKITRLTDTVDNFTVMPVFMKANG